MRTNLRVLSQSARPSARQRRRRSSGLPWLLFGSIAAGLVVLAGIIVAAVVLWPQPPSRSSSCKQILSSAIDLSDKPSDIARLGIIGRLDRLPVESCKGSLMQVWQFRPSADVPVHALFSGEDPGTSSEAPWETKKLVEQRRENEFAGPLRAQLERVLVPDQRRQSLVIEGLSHITRQPAYKGDDPTVHKTLIIVSDLLEHSNLCSMYPAERAKVTRSGSAVDWSVIRGKCAQLFRAYPLSLKGTDIEILWIKRGRAKNGGDLQPTEMQEFYEALFQSAGANNVIWRPL